MSRCENVMDEKKISMPNMQNCIKELREIQRGDHLFKAEKEQLYKLLLKVYNTFLFITAALALLYASNIQRKLWCPVDFQHHI